MIDFIKRCFKYQTLRELIDSYKKPKVTVESVKHNHTKAVINIDSIPKSALANVDTERYFKESEKELRKIERENFLEQQAYKMRQITVSAVTSPSSIFGELLNRLHSEIQALSEKDFQDSAKVAYSDMFMGPCRIQGASGCKKYFSIYRANRKLSLIEIDKLLSLNSKK